MDDIREISLGTARPFIEKFHYSGKVPTGKNIYFGWFIDNSLYAVADYGIGVNTYQAEFLKRVTGQEVFNSNLLELKRLARSEPRLEKHPLTRFLSLCHKLLKKRGYKYVVSFSDPAFSHTGGIYRAANFKHLGKTNAEWHVIDKDGVIHHRRFAYRHMQRHGGTIEESRRILGLTRIQRPPKDRWFIKI